MTLEENSVPAQMPVKSSAQAEQALARSSIETWEQRVATASAQNSGEIVFYKEQCSSDLLSLFILFITAIAARFKPCVPFRMQCYAIQHVT